MIWEQHQTNLASLSEQVTSSPTPNTDEDRVIWLKALETSDRWTLNRECFVKINFQAELGILVGLCTRLQSRCIYRLFARPQRACCCVPVPKVVKVFLLFACVSPVWMCPPHSRCVELSQWCKSQYKEEEEILRGRMSSVFFWLFQIKDKTSPEHWGLSC